MTPAPRRAAAPPPQKPQQRDRRGRGSLIRVGLLVVLAGAAVAVSIIVVPDMDSEGVGRELGALELGTGNTPDGAGTTGKRIGLRVGGRVRVLRPIAENVDGYIVEPRGAGTVTVPLRIGISRNERAILRLWASSSEDVRVRVRLIGGKARYHDFGTPDQWAGKAFDVTRQARAGPLTLRANVASRSPEQFLFLDRISYGALPKSAIPTVKPAWLALWVGLLAALLLQAAGKLRRHWPLPIATAIAGYVLWDGVLDRSLLPLDAGSVRLWTDVRTAGWVDLESGLLSGSFRDVSALAVQLYHALTPLVGTADAAAHAASALVGVAAVGAIYALGNRVAGRTAAVAAVTLTVLADYFRDSVTAGTAVAAMLLAAALFCYALHASLAEASALGVVGLALTGGLAVLADSVWLAGVVAVIVFVALRYGPPGRRSMVLGIGLVVFAIVLLPNRLSVAERSNDDILGDISDRATLVRNQEFAGYGHGAPSPEDVAADPLSGRPVGLSEYMFVEHSASTAVGGTVTGAKDVLAAYADRDSSRLAGLLAFALGLLGVVYLLIVPRLRMLVIAPAVIAIPEFFFVSRSGSYDVAAAGAATWPALAAGAGLLVYVIAIAYGPRLAPAARLPRVGRRLVRRVDRPAPPATTGAVPRTPGRAPAATERPLDRSGA